MTNLPTYHLISALGAESADEARQHLKSAHLAMMQHSEIPDSPSMVDVADVYAKHLRCIGNNPEKAMYYYKKSLAMLTRILTGE